VLNLSAEAPAHYIQR